MWLPLAAITRSNRGRKLLQAFLTKPFLFERPARFTDTASSFVLLWRVFQVFSLTYVCSNLVTIVATSSYWHLTSPVHSFCLACRLSVLLEDVILVIVLTHGRSFVSKISLYAAQGSL